MDLVLTTEQQMLEDSVARFVSSEYGFEARSRLVESGGMGTEANWRCFAENGWLAAAIPEALGGLGGSVVDTAIISQQLGRGLVLEPYLGCGVLAAQTLVAIGGPRAAELLAAQCEGTQRFALAYSEPASRGLPLPQTTRATRKGTGQRLSGRKTLVLGTANVDGYIVSARTSGDDVSRDDVSLFLVRPDDRGVSCAPLRLHDGSTATEITFADAHAELLGRRGAGLAALDHGLTHAMLALCAELVGGMERSIEITAEYLRARNQFGVSIATFQSLQHRMADMAAEMELARSMLFAALASFEMDDADTRRAVLASAKTFVTAAARNVCGQGIQLHGGIGMAEECAVGHFFKRAVVADALFGGTTVHEAAGAAHLQSRLLGEPGRDQASAAVVRSKGV